MSVHQLSSIRLDPEAGHRRNAPKGVVVKADSFWDRYDSQTLIYDAIHCAQRRELRLYLPRTLNYKGLLASATIKVDDKPQTQIRWRKWRHHEVLIIRGLSTAKTLSIILDDQTHTIPIHAVDIGLSDLNCLYTLSKDNDLDWIKDWARFHVIHHGLEAVVFFDNGSTRYHADELDATLRTVPGLKAVRVVAANLPHGPLNQDCTNRSDAKFLQVAMLNLARDRFLSRARSWLTLDVDELLLSPTRESIFDAVEQNRWGHLTFPGIWHYPDESDTRNYQSHRSIRPGDAPCPTKYALRPSGPFGNFALQVHSLERIHRKFSFVPKRFWFMHCRGISTSWKYTRALPNGPFEPATDLAQNALDVGFDL